MADGRRWRARRFSTIVAGIVFIQCLGSAAALFAQNLSGKAPPPGGIWLDTLDLSTMTQDWGSPGAGTNVDGGPLVVGGVSFTHGVGTHANSDFIVNLRGSASRFVSEVGVDADAGAGGSVTFEVKVDDVVKATTPVLRGGDKPVLLDIDLSGADKLELIVGDAGDGIGNDHADWAGAAIVLLPGSALPSAAPVPVEPARMVVPVESSSPAIHYPQITGATPGRPFLFKVPATGSPPLLYSAADLPKGLSLDPETGVISGSLTAAGRFRVRVSVSNAFGEDRSILTIVGGSHVLALTPPMGWNSWNVWADRVDEQKVKEAADAMMSSGLAGHGFAYVNIDDTWEGGRDVNGNIQSNAKFPDMKVLADYMHAEGLKAGLYSSPGSTTCAGFPASYRHEDQDAQTYADWGFDYLKYDWCSYHDIDPNPDLAGFQKPYAVMRASLDKVDRDIVFSFCQYGMGDVWTWGQQVGGNCWRTTGDIDDSWRSLHSIYESQDRHEKYAGPGHWNDPDMLTVGVIGWGHPHSSRLTPNEQILHISMWCLLSAPLLIGCDMSKLDPFTLALLTNDEALAIDQDQLGRPAGKVATTPNGGEVWARPLADGSQAVGLINPTGAPLLVAVNWSQLGLSSTQHVRDLWLHQYIGDFDSGYSVTVPTHGAVLLKVWPK